MLILASFYLQNRMKIYVYFEKLLLSRIINGRKCRILLETLKPALPKFTYIFFFIHLHLNRITYLWKKMNRTNSPQAITCTNFHLVHNGFSKIWPPYFKSHIYISSWIINYYQTIWIWTLLLTLYKVNDIKQYRDEKQFIWISSYTHIPCCTDRVTSLITVTIND